MTTGKKQTKRETFTLRAKGTTLLTTPDRQLAETIAEQFFRDHKTVTLHANAQKGKTMQRWNYGHPQK